MSKKEFQKFKVTNEEVGGRVDIFLVGKFPEFSRSWIGKLIEGGNVRVGRKKVLKSYRLKVGENVFFAPELPPEISLEPDSKFDKKIRIVHDNKNFLVIEKPSGLVVHPSSSTPNGTLVNWLLYRYPKVKGVGEDVIRPGIVHRLDKDTSGLMVVARNQKTFTWLKGQFKDRRVIKKYLTLVLGETKEDGGEIVWPIGRAKKDPTKQVVYRVKGRAPEGAREATTYWQVIKRFSGVTYLEVVPKTGRMHQIRVHLRAIGHPIVGDSKYMPKGAKTPKHIGRMFLHASFLSFTSSRGEKFSFNSPIPDELSKALKNLPFMLK